MAAVCLDVRDGDGIYRAAEWLTEQRIDIEADEGIKHGINFIIVYLDRIAVWVKISLIIEVPVRFRINGERIIVAAFDDQLAGTFMQHILNGSLHASTCYNKGLYAIRNTSLLIVHPQGIPIHTAGAHACWC